MNALFLTFRSNRLRYALRLRALALAVCLLGTGPLARVGGADKPARSEKKDAEVLAAREKGEQLLKQGKTAEAIKQLEKAVALAEEVLGKDARNTAAVLNELARAYSAAEQYAVAEATYLRSLKILDARKSKDDADAARVAFNLARVYLEQLHRPAKAEPLLQRAIKSYEASPTSTRDELAVAYHTLGNLKLGMGDHTAAEVAYLRALQLWEKERGPKDKNVGVACQGLGRLYEFMKKYDQAEEYLQRGLKITEAALGPDHLNIAPCLVNIGRLEEKQGHLEQAEAKYRQAAKIVDAQREPESELAGTIWTHLADLQAKQGRWDDAVVSTDRIQRAKVRTLARLLPLLSEAEQKRVLSEEHEEPFYEAITIALARRADPKAAALSAAWVLNGKGMTSRALAERELLARDSRDPALRDAIKELRAVRDRLGRASLASPAAIDDARAAELRRLAEQEQELAQRLGRAVGRPAGWADLAEVRKRLPANAVFISIVKYNPREFQAPAGEHGWSVTPHYAAWVIPPSGEVRIVDLGRASIVEAAVRNARATLAEAPRRLREEGEVDAEKECQQRFAALSRLVFQPLLRHVGAATELVLSPDGALWLVPWSALPVAGGKYAIEKYRISYVTDGRQLLAAPTAAQPGKPLVVADPDYDLAPDSTKPPRPGDAPPDSPTRALTLRRAARLPGTAAEAQAVTPLLKAWARAEPTVFTGKQALESVVKAARGPRVLVLSTHGYFLEDLDNKPGHWDEEAARRAADPLTNPLLRCGLLFAGVNNRGKASVADDGILTGMEIVSIDLRGTELVVLSACETGLGEVRNGEGVAGLRQAFQLAGAQAVVATLWQVPDRESAQLMTGFFDRLAKGQSKAQALRESQLQLIAKRRDRDGAAHPFFWAAFTLTGGVEGKAPKTP